MAAAGPLSGSSISPAPSTGAGFAKLSGLKKLEYLGLQYVPISDASMPVIGRNTNLKNQTLSFTRVSDAGLPLDP